MKNHWYIYETIAPVPENSRAVVMGRGLEVVRCKECKFNVNNMKKDPLDITDYSGVDIVCSYFMTDGQKENDFCSHGAFPSADSNILK